MRSPAGGQPARQPKKLLTFSACDQQREGRKNKNKNKVK